MEIGKSAVQFPQEAGHDRGPPGFSLCEYTPEVGPIIKGFLGSDISMRVGERMQGLAPAPSLRVSLVHEVRSRPLPAGLLAELLRRTRARGSGAPERDDGASRLTTYQMRVEIAQNLAVLGNAATTLLPTSRTCTPKPTRGRASRERAYTWNCGTVGLWRQSTSETLGQSTNDEYLAPSERNPTLTYQSLTVPLFAIRARAQSSTG